MNYRYLNLERAFMERFYDISGENSTRIVFLNQTDAFDVVAAGFPLCLPVMSVFSSVGV